jgi:hypothetical protein
MLNVPSGSQSPSPVRFAFTWQIHLVTLKPFEAEKAISFPNAFHQRKKSPAFPVAAPDSGATSLAISILRRDFDPADSGGRN